MAHSSEQELGRDVGQVPNRSVDVSGMEVGADQIRPKADPSRGLNHLPVEGPLSVAHVEEYPVLTAPG